MVCRVAAERPYERALIHPLPLALVLAQVRVVKTAKQTADSEMSYAATVGSIVATDGVYGLFFRGLGTKIISNGVQAMLFTVVWRYLQDVIAKRQALKAAASAKAE